MPLIPTLCVDIPRVGVPSTGHVYAKLYAVCYSYMYTYIAVLHDVITSIPVVHTKGVPVPEQRRTVHVQVYTATTIHAIY